MFGTFISEPEIEKTVALFAGDEPEKRFYRATLLVKSCRPERIRSAISLFMDLLGQRHTMYERECTYYIAAGYYVLGDVLECRLWVTRLLRQDPNHSQGIALQKTVESMIRNERKQRVKEIKQKRGKFKQPGLLGMFNTPSGQQKTNLIITSFHRRIRERRKMLEKIQAEDVQQLSDGEEGDETNVDTGPEDAELDVNPQQDNIAIVENYVARFTREELEALIKSFQSIDKLDSTVFDKEQFAQAMGALGFNNNEFVYRHLFSAFEIMHKRLEEHSSIRRHQKRVLMTVIELETYLSVMAILLKGTPDERLDLAFDMITYRTENDYITEEDLAQVLKPVFESLAQLDLDAPEYQQTAKLLFALLDKENEGRVSRAEFLKNAWANYGTLSGLNLLSADNVRGITEYRGRGARVLFGSSNWNTALMLMIGMRVTQSMYRPLVRAIRPEDFHTEVKIRMPSRASVEGIMDDGNTNSNSSSSGSGSGSGINSSSGGNVGHFIDFAPRVFQRLRQLFGISEDQYAMSIGLEQLCGNLLFCNLTSLSAHDSDGRSGSYFYYSHDGRFIVKYIPEKEMLAFKRLLPHYFGFVLAHPRSLMTKFVSCFEHNGDGFIVMTNVFNTMRPIHEIYDLKGSRVARSNPAGPVYKDNDLTQKVDIGERKKRLLLGVIYEDIKLLLNLKFTDYSLLLGVHYLDMSEFYKSQHEKQQLAEKKKKKSTKTKTSDQNWTIGQDSDGTPHQGDNESSSCDTPDRDPTVENSGTPSKPQRRTSKRYAWSGNDDIPMFGGSSQLKAVTPDGDMARMVITELTERGEREKDGETADDYDEDSEHVGNDGKRSGKKGRDVHIIIHHRSQKMGASQHGVKQGSDGTDVRSPNGWQRRQPLSQSIDNMLFEQDGGILSRDGKRIYYLGIIDTLTEFDMKKAAERNIKTLKYPTRRNEISAQPPDEYAQRMKEFVIDKII